MTRASTPMGGRRDVNGVLLLDKPTGLTSNAALQAVKRLFAARKAGHTGSLDPLASGLLPICMGEATKFSGLLLSADKTYRFTCRLGVVTSTGDAEGEVIGIQDLGNLERPTVEAVLRGFLGRTRQLPPMYSALKHRGKRLYELARQGLEVAREPREITIHKFSLLSLEHDRLECEVSCSKGTYVRTLAQDVGQVLGCGAHIVQLRRIGVASYDGSRMVALETLECCAQHGFGALDALLLPIDSALSKWPAVHLSGELAYFLGLGQPVLVPCSPTAGPVRLYQGNEGRFLGMGEILSDGRVAPRRLVRVNRQEHTTT